MKSNQASESFKIIPANVRKPNSKDVDSPYAKYNSRGQLMCIVCGVPVKSKIIWQAHIKKKSHLENIEILNNKQQQLNNVAYKNADKESINQTTPSITLIENSTKSLSLNATSLPPQPKGILKRPLQSNYSSSDEEDESKRIKTDIAENNITPLENKAKNIVAKTGELPEGFFDDPVADAKARNVEYRDKKAEEWEHFLKEVSAATVTSTKIIEEDKEEAAVETQLQQTNEQINCLQRIVELDKSKKCQVSEKKQVQNKSEFDDSSSDEEFSTVIWRTRNSLI